MAKKIFVNYTEEFFDKYLKLKKIVSKEKFKDINKSFHQQLLRSIDKTTNMLKNDPQIGIHIPQKYITKKVSARYGTKHLWKINLPNYWRMIYSITGNKIEVITLVLEMMNHKGYNKLFNYKNK